MAAIFFRGHPYIWRTTVRHDTANSEPTIYILIKRLLARVHDDVIFIAEGGGRACHILASCFKSPHNVIKLMQNFQMVGSYAPTLPFSTVLYCLVRKWALVWGWVLLFLYQLEEPNTVGGLYKLAMIYCTVFLS